jgi:hypothetical protein
MCSDRLSSIPPDHLLLLAREGMFGFYNENVSVDHITKMLERAATDGGESEWLLDKLRRSKDPIPEYGYNNCNAKMTWLANFMTTEDNPWGWYYRGRALWNIIHRSAASFELLKKSAEAGFAPAMSFLGSVTDGKEERTTWFRKAAELNDPDGLYESALCSRSGGGDRMFELLCKAVTLGHALSMWRLARDFSDRLSPVEVVSFRARYVLYSGVKDVTGPTVLSMSYAAGRELDGYCQFWDNDCHPDISYLMCIKIYRAVTRRARRAALQTVAVLKKIRLPRDVAKLIGQAVYATRTDACAWKK